MCKPLVSIIIPTYNRLHTLPRAIASVLAQSYTNIEVIVVDDGSTDGTDKYMEAVVDTRVKYVRLKENRGPAGARNHGVEIAKGEYVAFQDSDDEWIVDKLEKQMELLLKNPDTMQMVYCAMQGMYEDGSRGEILPSIKIPMDEKSGEIFEYLLQTCMIGTVAMVVSKKSFQDIGGFCEVLKSLEDYEFSLRFAKKNGIGFVDEVLVIPHVSANSVNKRYYDKLDTQFYIVKNMYKDFRYFNSLMEKMIRIKQEAEDYGCEEYFKQQVEKISYIFTADEKKMVEKICSKRMTKENEIANSKMELVEQFQILKNVVSEICAGRILRIEKERRNTLSEVISNTYKIIKILDLPKNLLNRGKKLQNVLADNEERKVNVFEEVEKLFEDIEEACQAKVCICNVCQNKVIFNPISDYYKKNRELYGFPYVDAKFQLESETNYRCPICGANDRDRLMITFLNCLNTEEGEKLKMLQIAPSDTIENWAKENSSILYESTDLFLKNVTFVADIQDLHMVEDENYDIIVCSHVLNCVENDKKAMNELFRILKPQGVCLVLVSVLDELEKTDEEWGCDEGENWRRFGRGDYCRLYEKNDFIVRLQEAGFTVNELGQSWFGEEYYKTYGFNELSIMYVVTKGIQI